MNDTTHSPHTKDWGKDKHFRAQMRTVFAAFLSEPKTMLMVEVETGIMRPNICRYVAKWEKAGKIHPVKKAVCPISKHRAKFYTANPQPELFPATSQPSKTGGHE